VALYDLARLQREGFTRVSGMEEELARARDIALAEAEVFETWLRSRAADAFLAKLQQLATGVADAEISRALARIENLDHRGREAVTTAVERAVRKLVHQPLVRGREAAARGDGAALQCALWLFGLEEQPAEVPGRSPG
jgi:glutamyl-tRNA reductase